MYLLLSDGSHTHSLEATHRCRGTPRRTSEAAMMRLYHSILMLQFRVLSLVVGIWNGAHETVRILYVCQYKPTVLGCRGCLHVLTCLFEYLVLVFFLLRPTVANWEEGKTSGSHTHSLEATRRHPGTPRRTSEAAMMRLSQHFDGSI